MPEGSVTYAPEGVFYGPQQGHGALVLGLQFGDASGSGFMSYDRLAEGNKRLNENPDGVFEGGVWRYVDLDGNRRNQDGYEAIWEEIHGRPVEYPTPRYQTPVTMLPDAYSWTTTDEPGVERKHLGTFTERRTTVRFLRYAGGATHRVHDRSPELHFVLDGTLRVGDGIHSRWTAFKFDPGEEVVLEALEPTTTYVIGLPVF